MASQMFSKAEARNERWQQEKLAGGNKLRLGFTRQIDMIANNNSSGSNNNNNTRLLKLAGTVIIAGATTNNNYCNCNNNITVYK